MSKHKETPTLRLFRKSHDEHRCERRFARTPRDEHGPGHRFGRGGRLARFLEHGDLRLLVLHLISEKPRHGYEIIKAIEDLAGGAYAPSPGVIYPTLTMLEELGQVESAAEGTRKQFTITPAGQQVLAEGAQAVAMLLGRIAATQPREESAPVIRAMENVRTALRMKLGAHEPGSGLPRKIADLLDAVARQIEEL
jgi:DNA-binding PadR family transcriptional regulator